MRIPSRLIPVSLAVNNDSGMCSGAICMLHVGHDSPLELEAMWFDEEIGDFSGPKFDYHFRTYPNWHERGWMPKRCRGDIQIETRRFPFVAYKSHVGNIMWDMVYMTIRDCLRMLRWLRRHSCSCGPMELFDLWENPRRELKPIHLLSTI